MTIHNIYLTIGFSLWAYLLICFCCKLFSDALYRKLRGKRIHRINVFFSSGHVDRSRVRSFQKILRYAKDDALFNYICDRYAEMLEMYTVNEKAILELYMRKIFHMRIHQLNTNDRLGRCALIDNIYRCRVTSDEIRLFLLECGEHTQLEQYCIDLHKAFWPMKSAR